jgi:O-antigen/teichoic acid export membrane protein
MPAEPVGSESIGGPTPTIRSTEVRAPDVRVRRTDTTALAAGSAANGLLAYVVFALSTRALGPAAAAPVSVLWTYWGFAGAAFTFPLQHWIARTVTAHGEGAVRRALPRVFVAVLGASVVVGGLCWLGRMPLFHIEGWTWPALVALLTLGSGVIGVVRGRLNASRRFIGIGASLAAENGLRCVAVGALFLAGVRNPIAYGLSLVAGHLVSLFWLRSIRFGHTLVSTTERHTPLAFLSGAGFAQLLGQLVLTGSPVVLALAGGAPADVTALFTTLALFRAPYILALGLVSQLTSKLTALVVAGQAAALRRLRSIVVVGTLIAVALAGVVGEWLGPVLLELIFGSKVSYNATHSALVAMACTFAVANLVVTISLLALNRAKWVAAGWLGAVLICAIGFAALAWLPAASQIVCCFLIAEAAAFAILVLIEARPGHTRA